MQDRFHVAKGVAESFNNSDARFSSLVIRGLREATVVRDATREAAVDESLKAGTIAKKKGQTTIIRGTELTGADVQDLKASGAYHDMFSTKYCIVPEYVKDAPTLKLSVDRWAKMIEAAAFHPPDNTGVRKPILINGKQLIASLELLAKVKTNALKRILNCIPPQGFPSYELTGETDPNGFDIMKPLIHTCRFVSLLRAQLDALSSLSNVNSACTYGKHRLFDLPPSHAFLTYDFLT